MSHTKWAFSSVLMATIIFLSRPAFADQCNDLHGDPEPRIVACTDNINSGKWKGRNQAINYFSRGAAGNVRSFV
ncbi:MAG TPA: hypothetical protein VKT76_04950 [Bradyrhizobium sp.]|nr:hypothetical protein [Bradyrhizobium sp.]